MVRKRKGIGYVIEGFIASLVIFIFVLGGLTVTSSQENWEEYQDEIAAQDISYVMLQANYTDKMVAKGEKGSISTAFSALTDEKLQVSGSLDNSAAGTSQIGFYAPENKIIQENVTEVTAGDRCAGDLSEIESEPSSPILRTQNTTNSLERKYGVRLYISDNDPRSGSGFNGEEDYDTLWVDRGNNCQFSSSEGPLSTERLFEWSNNSISSLNRFYDFRKVTESSNKKIVLYNATLGGKISKYSKELNQPLTTDLVMDSFNFSKTSLNDYDILVFWGNKSLEGLNNNHRRVLEYNKEGSVLVASELELEDIENNSYLNKTGLRWVDLNYTKSGSPGFTGLSDSERLHYYFDSLNYDECDFNSMNSGGKVSSSNNQNYISDETLFSNPGTVYNTSNWDAINNSMIEGVSGPVGVKDSECDPSYSNGTFEFPTENGNTEEFDVYNTNLGKNECIGTKAISIDLNKNGDVSGDDEGLYFDGANITINNRMYKVNIESFSEVSFNYIGAKKVEYVNYRTSFPSQDIDKFARTGNLSDNGNLGGSDDKQIALTMALMQWMSEDEVSFGPEQNSYVSHQSIGSYGENPMIPYKLYLRWSR